MPDDLKTTISRPLFDVIAINLTTHVMRVIDERKTAKNAEAIISAAVVRRGTEEEIFAAVPTGQWEHTWLVEDDADQDFANRMQRDFEQNA